MALWPDTRRGVRPWDAAFIAASRSESTLPTGPPSVAWTTSSAETWSRERRRWVPGQRGHQRPEAQRRQEGERRRLRRREPLDETDEEPGDAQRGPRHPRRARGDRWWWQPSQWERGCAPVRERAMSLAA